MALSVKMYPARNGDAFLITGEGEITPAVLIDGGYDATVREYILPDLQDLARRGGSLDLAVATHVDADHVSGLLHLFQVNGPASASRIIRIREVWHNSLRSIRGLLEPEPIADPAAALADGDRDLLLQIRRRGYPQPSARTAGAAAEIGARQGSSLAALLLAGGYRWNGGAGETPILGVRAGERQELNSTTYLTILGPSPLRLHALGEWWLRELRREGFTGVIGGGVPFDDAFEFLAASRGEPSITGGHPISGSLRRADATLSETHVPDVSPTNASSISFILHSGPHAVLFLADACAGDVEAALREVASGRGSLAGPPLMFDAIKIAHHGSRRNTSPALLELIDSPRYLISTNGERHDHPDLEVLKAIVDRPAPFRRDLFFNYPTRVSEALKTHASTAGAAFSVHEGIREVAIQGGPNEHTWGLRKPDA